MKRILIIILGAVLLLVACGKQQVLDISAESGPVSIDNKTDGYAASLASADAANGSSGDGQVVELPSEPYMVEVNQYIMGVSVLRDQHDSCDLFDIDGEYNPHFPMPHTVSHVSLTDFSEGSAIIEMGFGLGLDYVLVTIHKNESVVFPLPNYQEGPLATRLSNGLIAVSDGLSNQQITLYTPLGEKADVQLDFSYGNELTAHTEPDFPANYDTLGYEYCAEAIVYDIEKERYIMVFTTSAWLEYEKETTLSPSEVWVATFDAQGKETERFMISSDDAFQITSINKMHFLFGDSRLIYLGNDRVLLVVDRNYVYAIDLNEQQYQELTRKESDELLGELGLFYSDSLISIVSKEPPCPYSMISTSTGLTIYDSDDDVLAELDESYIPFGYSEDADGVGYLYFVRVYK